MVLKQSLSAEKNRSGPGEAGALPESPSRMIHNNPEDIQIRRSRDRLYTIGTGITAFGVWSIAKSILFLFSDLPQLVDLAAETGEKAGHVIPDEVLAVIFVSILLVILSLDIFLRLYIGICARKHARGTLKKKTYILFACLMIAGSAFAVAGGVLNHILQLRETGPAAANAVVGILERTGRNGSITAVFVEATSMIMMAELVINAVRIMRAERQKSARF